jgi:type III secretion protein R
MILAPAAQAASDIAGKPLLLVVGIAIASLLPFVLMGATAFVKISTVLQIVKSAIGAQSVPSGTVVMVLAGSLSLLAMAPVAERMSERVTPLLNSDRDAIALVRDGAAAISEPMRDFFKANASATERMRFFKVAQEARPEADRSKVHESDFAVLLPSFVVTELAEAFKMGFLLYLPFLVIDLVIANVLLALGMQMMNPTQVSLPFKLLLFAAINGWGLLSQALVSGYR